MIQPDQQAVRKLEEQKNIWVATVRSDGRPHLAPVWFVYYAGKVYFSTESGSVKARNLQQNPQIALALENGDHPVICEGRGSPLSGPVPPEVSELFFQKYEWKLAEEDRYSKVFVVEPQKWLVW